MLISAYLSDKGLKGFKHVDKLSLITQIKPTHCYCIKQKAIVKKWSFLIKCTSFYDQRCTKTMSYIFVLRFVCDAKTFTCR